MKYKDLELNKEYHFNYNKQDENFVQEYVLAPGTMIELICSEKDKMKRNGVLVLMTDKYKVGIKKGVTYTRSFPNSMKFKIIHKI